jgi:AIPR protein
MYSVSPNRSLSSERIFNSDIMTDIDKFYEELQADVIDESLGTEGNSGGDFKENAFTRIIVEDLAAAGVMESPIVCYCEDTNGASSMKVNAYSFPDEDSCLDLVVTAYYSDEIPRRLKGTDIDKLLNMAERYFRAATKKHHERLEPGSEAYAMTREIFSRKDDTDRVRIFLVSNGLAVQRKALERKEKVDQWNVSYEIWDLERLRRFRSSGATHEPVQVDLSAFDGGIRCATVSDTVRGYRTCVAILPGIVLHNWYDEYGSRLLELNVRSYLQARGKINAGILETIIKEPARFLSYNNGITIVAEQVHFNDAADRITSIQGLQIVNGGQTTASIHRAKKENRAELADVHVQAKITIVPADEYEAVVPDISRFSNTQNKVTEVDLGANHAFHVGVERVALNTWAPGEQSMWFYERARGSYQTIRSRSGGTRASREKFDRKYPVDQKFSKEELGRYWNTWNGLAPVVNKGGQKNFVKFMESLPKVDKGWEPSRDEFREIIAKAILFRNAQEIARKRKLTAFGINIVIYTVALLAEKTARRIDLQSIWNHQRVSTELAALLADWLDQTARLLKTSVGDRNPGEWFKQEACWAQLKESTSDWKLPSELSAQLVKADGTAHALPDDLHNAIAQCMQVDAPTWFEIQVWGRKSGELASWQTGIANTLSGYAAGGWEKTPSVKQATHGIKILEAYRATRGDA